MNRARVWEIAQSFLSKGDSKGWFEAVYDAADGNSDVIPWANMRPNLNLEAWLSANTVVGAGKRALVVGCGLGDDADLLASYGFAVTAFDISPKAIAWCKQRFPNTGVDYVAADLLNAPVAWAGWFDLVVEIYTLQVLPQELRPAAMQALAGFLAPGGVLLVIARGREPEEDRGTVPWPLTRAEVEEIAGYGLKLERFEDFMDGQTPPVRRFRVAFRREE